MRPFVTAHDRPEAFVFYILRAGSEPLGGTVPIKTAKDMAKRFERYGQTPTATEVFRHITLSLPEGYTAGKQLWLAIAQTTLRLLGLDPTRMPWFAVRHTDSACDHLHIGICLCDFTGRVHPISSPSKRCKDVHIFLCDMLGLPAPQYFDQTALPRLDPITPARRLTSAQKKLLHRDLRDVFA